jgi:hypothetical protein
MDHQIISLAVDYAVARLGCERALELLTNPNALEFDADKVIKLLETILEPQK